MKERFSEDKKETKIEHMGFEFLSEADFQFFSVSLHHPCNTKNKQ